MPTLIRIVLWLRYPPAWVLYVLVTYSVACIILYQFGVSR